MRIAVIGAAGKTGGRVVTQAIDRGHEVVAVARRPPATTGGGRGVEAVVADARDPDAMRSALDGCDGVVSALGVSWRSRGETTLYSTAAINLLAAMGDAGVTRLVVVSAAPVGPRGLHPPLQRRVVLPLLHRAFGAAYRDMERMEAILRGSDRDWVSLRPPRLLAKPGRGSYRLELDAPPRGGRSLRYDDLAAALLDVVSGREPNRTAAYLSN